MCNFAGVKKHLKKYIFNRQFYAIVKCIFLMQHVLCILIVKFPFFTYRGANKIYAMCAKVFAHS